MRKCRCGKSHGYGPTRPALAPETITEFKPKGCEQVACSPFSFGQPRGVAPAFGWGITARGIWRSERLFQGDRAGSFSDIFELFPESPYCCKNKVKYTVVVCLAEIFTLVVVSEHIKLLLDRKN